MENRGRVNGREGSAAGSPKVAESKKRVLSPNDSELEHDPPPPPCKKPSDGSSVATERLDLEMGRGEGGTEVEAENQNVGISVADEVEADKREGVIEKSNGEEELKVANESTCVDKVEAGSNFDEFQAAEKESTSSGAVDCSAEAAVMDDNETMEKWSIGEELKVDVIMAGVNERTFDGDVKVGNKMGTCSDDIKQREDADSDNERTAEKENQTDEIKIDNKGHPGMDNEKINGKWSTEEKLEVDKKLSMRSYAIKQDKAFSDRQETIEAREDEKGFKGEKKHNFGSEETKQHENACTNNKKARKGRKDEGSVKVFKKRFKSPDGTKEREEANSGKNRSVDRGSKEELQTDKRIFLRSDVNCRRRVPEEMDTGMKFRAGKKGSAVRETAERREEERREEVKSDEKKAAAKGDFLEQIGPEELAFDKKRPATLDDIKPRVEAGKKKKKATGLRAVKEVNHGKTSSSSSAVVAGSDEIQDNGMEVSDLGLKSKVSRKRVSETPDIEVSLMKIKTDLKRRQGQVKKIDKKMKTCLFNLGDQRTEAKADTILCPEQFVSVHRQRDDTDGTHVDLDSTIKPGAGKFKLVYHSGQRSLWKLKDNSDHGGSIKRKEYVNSENEGDVLTLLPSNKKVGMIEKVGDQREDENIMKKSTTANCSTPKHPSFSGGTIVKPSSTSLSEKHKLREIRRDVGTSLRARKYADHSGKKHDILGRVGSNSVPGTPPLSKENKEEAPMSRAIIKQSIRKQIKDILLNAGWKIDLRPRKGKDYEDQVYIPPAGGSCYWSITKAYEVFQKQSNLSSDGKTNTLSAKSSEKSTGNGNLDSTCSSSSAIPAEFLSMLRRITVKRRRRRIEVEEKQDSGTEKARKTTKMKHRKNKGLEKTTAGAGGRKKLKFLAASKIKNRSGKDTKKQKGCTLLVRGANQGVETDGYVPYMGKRTVLSWMIDLRVVPINGRVRYKSKKQICSVLEGRLKRDGIRCSCCRKIITVSNFEIHAGSTLNQPFKNIFLESSGISLLQCLLDAWEKQDLAERRGFYTQYFEGDDPNDDTCGFCGDGGDLICCDGCPSTFHQSCLDIEILPSGDWHCYNCLCRFCGLAVVFDRENNVPVSSLLSCYQCEEKYHEECVPNEDAISTSSKATFCGRSCRTIFKGLQKLVGVMTDLEAGFSLRIIRRLDEDSHLSQFGLTQRAECNAKIAVALSVMDECFLPIVDQRSGINLIRSVVYNYGSNFHRMSYSGFYTFVLERGDEIISAASIRVHGIRLAEMPFIGTRNMYRRQGMCRRLLNGIESVLCSLGVQKLIIPATSELTDTWTAIFGFEPLNTSQLREIKLMNVLVFPESGMLQKSMQKKDSILPSIKASMTKTGVKHCLVSEVAAQPSRLCSAVPNIHASGGAIGQSKEVLKDGKDPEHKFSVGAADAKFLPPEAVHENRSVHRDTSLVETLAATKTDVLCGVSVQNIHNLDIGEAGIVLNTHTIGSDSVKHASEAKYALPNDTASASQNVGTETSPNLSCVDGSLLPEDSEAYCTLTGVTSILQDSGGKGLSLPEFSLVSTSEAIDMHASNITSTSSSLLPVEPNLQASEECIVDGNYDLTFKMSNIHATGVATANPIHEDAQVVSNSISDTYDVDAEVHAFGFVSRSCKIPLGEKNHPCDISHVPQVSDVISRPICAASGHGFQVLNSENSTQHDSLLFQGPTEFPNVDHPFASETDCHRVQDSVNSLCFSSLPEPDESSRNHMLKNSYDTKDGSGSLEQTVCSLGTCSSCLGSDMVCRSPDVGCKPSLLSSPVDGCNISIVPLCSDAAHFLTCTVGNNSREMAVEDSSFGVGSAKFCSSILNNGAGESFGIDPSSVCSAIPDPTNPHSAERAGHQDDLCEKDCIVPTETWSTSACSTSIAVDPKLTETERHCC